MIFCVNLDIVDLWDIDIYTDCYTKHRELTISKERKTRLWRNKNTGFVAGCLRYCLILFILFDRLCLFSSQGSPFRNWRFMTHAKCYPCLVAGRHCIGRRKHKTKALFACCRACKRHKLSFRQCAVPRAEIQIGMTLRNCLRAESSWRCFDMFWHFSGIVTILFPRLASNTCPCLPVKSVKCPIS